KAMFDFSKYSYKQKDMFYDNAKYQELEVFLRLYNFDTDLVTNQQEECIQSVKVFSLL
ncbi:32021_t:CDS:2, partial [Racocetra persica]